MKTPQKFRTMYMHTLDGRPANYNGRHGAYMYFASGRTKVELVKSRTQIARESQACIAAARSDPNQREWTIEARYGHVSVKVPL